VPLPISVSTEMRPPRRSTRSRTMARPRPRPDMSVIMGLVDIPDSKMSCNSSASSILATCSGERIPSFIAAAPSLPLAIPAPSSAMTNSTLSPSQLAMRMVIVARAGLPAATTVARLLDTVIEGVAHKMKKRIAQIL